MSWYRYREHLLGLRDVSGGILVDVNGMYVRMHDGSEGPLRWFRPAPSQSNVALLAGAVMTVADTKTGHTSTGVAAPSLAHIPDGRIRLRIYEAGFHDHLYPRYVWRLDWRDDSLPDLLWHILGIEVNVEGFTGQIDDRPGISVPYFPPVGKR